MNKLILDPRHLLLFVLAVGAIPNPAGQTQEKIKVDLLKVFEDHKNSLFSLARSPNKKYLVSGGVDKKVILWDVETWKPISISKEGDGKILNLQFSRDGTMVFATDEPSSIRVLAVPDLKEVRKIELDYRPIRVAVSPAMNTIAISGNGGEVQTFNYNTGTKIASFQGQEKNNQAILLTERLLYIAGETADGKGKLVALLVAGNQK